MSNELTEADRKAIDEAANEFCIGIENTFTRTDFSTGAEWGIKHARAEFEQDRKDAYSAGLMVERILAAGRIKELEAALLGAEKVRDAHYQREKELEAEVVELKKTQGAKIIINRTPPKIHLD